jgi:hypothetical protein
MDKQAVRVVTGCRRSGKEQQEKEALWRRGCREDQEEEGWWR